MADIQQTQRSRASIILAAGYSSRMGQPKALLTWQGETLLSYAVHQHLDCGCRRVVVVIGHEAQQVQAAIPEHELVMTTTNPDVAAGRASSIRIGAAALGEGWGAMLVQSVDQPVPCELIEPLFEAVESGDCLVAIPTALGRRGHPLVLSGSLLPELKQVSEERQGLREIVQRHGERITFVPVDDERILLNLNTREGYTHALDVWRREG